MLLKWEFKVFSAKPFARSCDKQSGAEPPPKENNIF